MLGLVLLAKGLPVPRARGCCRVWAPRHAGEAGASWRSSRSRGGRSSQGIHVGIHHGLGIAWLLKGQELLDRGDRRAAMPLLDRAIAQFGEALRIVPSYELSAAEDRARLRSEG